VTAGVLLPSVGAGPLPRGVGLPGLRFRSAPARTVQVLGAPDEAGGCYVYRLAQGDLVQIGVAGLVSLADYRSGRIRRHEQVERSDVRRRVRRWLADPLQRSPVLVGVRDDAAVAQLMADDMQGPVLASCVTEQGVEHTVWRARDPHAYTAAFTAHAAAWIADGHHRFASAARVAALWRRAHPPAAGEAPQEQLLAVLMPVSSLRILPYHRLLCGVGPGQVRALLQQAASVGRLQEGMDAGGPCRGAVGLYAEGRWWTLQRPVSAEEQAHPLRALDHDWVQRCLLGPVLGLRGGVAGDRVQPVAGQAGVAALAAAVDAGEADVALAMPAVSMPEVMRVADAGLVMPAKSTWFAPKSFADVLAGFRDYKET